MGKILITGGTGLVGSRLAQMAIEAGMEVVFLGRKAGVYHGIQCYQWNIQEQYIQPGAFEGVTAVVNLAGAGIAAHRWTQAYKTELYNSRILSTRLLIQTMNEAGISPEVLINASATGIYGNVTYRVNEENKPGTDFLASLCKQWEHEAMQFAKGRLVIMRLGIVMSAQGGFVSRLAAPTKWGAGAVLGNGNQMTSWIHIDDVCGIILKAINDSNMNGVYNIVAPFPETNKTLTHLIAKVLKRPILLPPVPKWVLYIIFGEMASSLLANQEIDGKRLLNTGYQFSYPKAETALKQLLQHTN